MARKGDSGKTIVQMLRYRGGQTQAKPRKKPRNGMRGFDFWPFNGLGERRLTAKTRFWQATNPQTRHGKQAACEELRLFLHREHVVDGRMFDPRH